MRPCWPTSGHFSEATVEACAKARIAPLIAPGRERHHRSWKERFAAAPPAPADPTALQAMAHRLAWPEGPASLRLAQTHARTGVRHHRISHGLSDNPTCVGLKKVEGEWNLVTLTWNMKPMFALNQV